MSSLDFQIDASQVRGWATAVRKAPALMKRELVNAMNTASAMGAGFAIEKAPVLQGILRGSIKPTVTRFGGDSITGGWTANAIHAAQREFGGEILPKRGKYLVFDLPDGTTVFAKRVVQSATPYMRPALQQLEPLLPGIFGKAVRRVLDGLR